MKSGPPAGTRKHAEPKLEPLETPRPEEEKEEEKAEKLDIGEPDEPQAAPPDEK